MPHGIQRIERQRQAAHALLLEEVREGLRDLHAVRADDDPESLRIRVTDDLEDVAAQQGLAAGQDRHGLGGESRDVVDDLEALLGVQLAAVGEGVVVDEGLAAGVEVAMLAGEVAAVGQIPGDDVRALEWRGLVHAHMPKRVRASSSTLSSIRA
jgi:hypothetical protein